MASPPKASRTSSDRRMEASLDSLQLLNALRSGDRDFLDSHMSSSTLLLACQVAELPTISHILNTVDVNAPDEAENTALHVGSCNGRLELIRLLAERDADDTVRNVDGRTPIDVAKSPEVTAELQKHRANFAEKANVQYVDLLTSRNAAELESFLISPRAKGAIDIDAPLPLHLAVKFGDADLARVLVAAGADVFARDSQGRTAIDLSSGSMKDILKKGSVEGIKCGNLSGTQMSGYLKKWTNYGGGWKLRWVHLESGVLSYYKNRDDVGSACRGSINMRVASIEKVTHKHDKQRFEFRVVGKGTSGFQFRANHQAEGKRWVWAITNAIQAAKEASKKKDEDDEDSTLVSDSLKRTESLNSMDDEDEEQMMAEEPYREKFGLTAQSVALQVDVLERLLGDYTSDTNLMGALRSVRNTVSDYIKMAGDREQYFKARIERELEVRRLWEENMQRVVEEQEQLERTLHSAERERKEAKRALRVAVTPQSDHNDERIHGLARRRSSVMPDDDSDEEFFDAVEAGEVSVVNPPEARHPQATEDSELASSFKGYDEPLRTKLSVVDDRPKISLWGILKSMIGKDMTKMTLPVSFNEPTSLLQRAAEDMEYSDLLDVACDRDDSTERILYVAAFAASEYSSTTLRVAKPFNPLLGETFEYCRPDKGYRFIDEQVSHHPPVAAVWAESPGWTFFGESAVKSKFTGKSFEIAFPTPWFLRMRAKSGQRELYKWKKVNTSVVGIITGSPTVDNYGDMEVVNITTGDVCNLHFKPRGWRGANAFEVTGHVKDKDGNVHWSIGGHWNNKLFARKYAGGDVNDVGNTDNAFLIWQNHERPSAAFNLTPFATSLNALPEHLKPFLPKTDTRFRPDQRAMEDARYDQAATEKNRLEEKQRAARRQREIDGESWKPRWFVSERIEETGDEYWRLTGDYWERRRTGDWKGGPEIF